MKKQICAAIAFVLALSLFGCGKSDTTVSADIDVDLTSLTSTMVYSEVYNMMNTPDNYVGKTVKMKGTFKVYEGETPDIRYYACIINDATACCQQGMECVLSGNPTYPEQYPQQDTEITVTGTFETYTEGETLYCHLNNATLG